MDYLEPIFTELEPPLLSLPLEFMVDDESANKWDEEFDIIARPLFDTNLVHDTEDIQETHPHIISARSYYQSVYYRLRFLNMKYAIEEIRDYANVRPGYIKYLLNYYALVTENVFNPLDATINHTLEYLKTYGGELFDLTKKSLPIEIGRFIMNKITLNPNTFYGCVSVIEHYKHNDLYTLLKSFENAIRERDRDRATGDINELSYLMDNIWKDSHKIGADKQAISCGISITLGIAGFLATSGLLGVGGLLAALGFVVADKGLDYYVSEKFAKVINKDNLYNIYDFRKRYPLVQ
jgi:hypothetical protein